MTAIQEQPPEISADAEGWEAELQKVGFVRRIFQARRWYGADWWFVVISTAMVVGFVVIALFPNWFAPYAPDALVGPRFLAANENPSLPIIIVPKGSPFNTLKDLAVPESQPRPQVAVVQGVPTGSALNEQAQVIDEQVKNEPGGLRLRPQIDRYASDEEALQAILDG